MSLSFEIDYSQMSEEDQLKELEKRGFVRDGDLDVLLNYYPEKNINLGYSYLSLLQLSDRAIGLSVKSISEIAMGGLIHCDLLFKIAEDKNFVEKLNGFTVSIYNQRLASFGNSTQHNATAAYVAEDNRILFEKNLYTDWIAARHQGMSKRY